MNSLLAAIPLALADLRREPGAFLVGVAAVAAVLAPVLILFGLKYGIVSAMTDRLTHDPYIRAIYPLGQTRYDPAWLQRLGAREEVAFLMPLTRYLSAEARIEAMGDGALSQRIELIPTGAGDPLVANETAIAATMGVPAKPPGIILTHRAAERSGLTAGQEGILRIARKRDRRQEEVRLAVRVVSVLPLVSFSRPAAFIDLRLLEAIEDYRAAWAVPRFGWEGDEPPATERRYASFRLYVRELDDIRPLRDWLVSEGVEVETRIAQVELVESIDRNLTFLFLVVAGLGIAGGGLSVALGLWGAVLRKRRILALLRLLGHSNLTLAAFPAIQGIVTAGVASVAALGIYAAVAPVMNLVFSHQLAAGEAVCRLLPYHAILAVMLTLLLSLAASGVAGIKAWRISPVEGLRDE
uniref:Putative ABC transport system permease protein n=1 Tax=Candidatus Kentrum sp. MB TaxID=2138164 RepID=A0A450XD86_9GAMM|nr:MAG: putative ABC transport system permease protein [Candidatus Kentron sp. MB]VFK31064.1 MAG: putative ABC transport system permease protein [Candidatus Kentron sp. MB]VFK75504.1 MAG: putative ABC transport system permease protein [Candidatus Kentron sp. MB]